MYPKTGRTLFGRRGMKRGLKNFPPIRRQVFGEAAWKSVLIVFIAPRTDMTNTTYLTRSRWIRQEKSPPGLQGLRAANSVGNGKVPIEIPSGRSASIKQRLGGSSFVLTSADRNQQQAQSATVPL